MLAHAHRDHGDGQRERDRELEELLRQERATVVNEPEVERGESVLRASSRAGVFTPVVLQMIAVGDETGELDDLMLEVAQLYEREVDYEIKTLAAQIEPILIVFLGVIVLILALGVFLPIWDLSRVALRR